MVYILINSDIQLDWTIFKSRSRDREELRDCLVQAFLVSEGNRWALTPSVDRTERGTVHLTLPKEMNLVPGVYGLKLVWGRNKLPGRHDELLSWRTARSICVSEAENVFAITIDQSSAPDKPQHYAIKTEAPTYGRDGLDAWERAIMLGMTTDDEASWTETGVSSVIWSFLGEEGEQQIDGSHLTDALADYAKSEDLNDYVTLDTDQTVTAKKTFSSNEAEPIEIKNTRSANYAAKIPFYVYGEKRGDIGAENGGMAITNAKSGNVLRLNDDGRLVYYGGGFFGWSSEILHKRNWKDVMTFDSVPTSGSTNPVTSDGIKTALDSEAQARALADTDLQGAIDTERGRAQDVEAGLQADKLDIEGDWYGEEGELPETLIKRTNTTQDNNYSAKLQFDGVNFNFVSDVEESGRPMINGEEIAVRPEVNSLRSDVTAINGKIPAQASAQNQLADKAFVNSSVATSTATFRGTYDSLAELQAVVGADENDYGFVIGEDADGNAQYSRYKYVTGTGWVFEYTLNNSSFTAAQWATIESGIVSGDKTKLDALPTAAELETLLAGKESTISDLSDIRSGASAGATAYQKPLGGIPSTDMSSEVQTSLGKAETALQSHQDISGKADKSEMSVTAGTGADADKTTIQLKNGTSATVLTAHQNISGKQDTISDLATIRAQAANAAPQSTTYTKTEVDTAIAGFITNTVNNLTNYYLKSETYTQSEVQQLIAAISQFRYMVESSLPTASAQTVGIIYLIPSSNPATQNVKDEYITISSTNEQQETVYAWEQIGSTTVDLSGYYTSAQTDATITSALNAALASYSTTSQMNTAITSALAPYYTKTEIDALLAGKQDVINDLATIRSQAAAAAPQATTYTKTEVDEKTPLSMSDINLPESDLDLSDEQGNVVASFYKGHFKTKNFDSATLGKNPDYIALYKASMKSTATEWANSSAWTWGNSGATPNAIGASNYLMLTKIYHSDKRFLRFSVAMGADTKLMLPVFHGTSQTQDPTNAGEGASCFAIDFASGKLVIYGANGYNGEASGLDTQATGTGFDLTNELETTSLSNDFVGARTYIVELHKDNTTSLLRIMDTLSGDSYEVSHDGWGAGRQNQSYGFYCESGTLPTISNVEVYSLNRPDVVFIGDSITEGVMVTDRTKRYPSLFRAANPNKKVVISARGGNTITAVLAKFESEYNIYKPKCMSVMIGTNGGNTTENLLQLKQMCDAIECRLILHNITALPSASQADRNSMLQSVRTSLGLNGAKMDVATSLNYIPSNGYNSALYYTGNGTHPNVDGQIKMYQRLLIDTPELFYETSTSKITSNG